MEHVLALRSQCKTEGKAFVDPDFPPEDASLYGNGDSFGMDIVWKRPNQIAEDLKDPMTVFKGAPSPSDIVQGRLGDCYAMAALSLVALNTQAVKNLFLDTEYNEQGVYGFRFYRYGVWETIIIDDLLPCTINGGPVFAASRDGGELWVSLLEKALAKFYGSYASLKGGNISEALVDMTSAPVEDYNFQRDEVQSDIKSGKLWKQVLNSLKKGHLVGAAAVVDKESVKDPDDNKGIVQNHAYSILGALELKQFKILKLRNPVGTIEWRGKFGRESKVWNSRLKAKLKYNELDDGEFYIEWRNFVKFYNRMYIGMLNTVLGVNKLHQIAEIKDSWSQAEGTCGGCSNYASWRKNPVYLIQTDQDVHFAALLQQPDQRSQLGHENRKIDYHQIGFTLVSREGSEPDSPFLSTERSDIVERTSFWNKRDVSIDLRLKAGCYALVPSTYFPNQESEFRMTLLGSSNDISLTKLDTSELKSYDFESKWKGKTAGGRPGKVNFKFNPKYSLNVPAGGADVYLSLHQHAKTPVGAGVYVFRNASTIPAGGFGNDDVVGKFVFTNKKEVHRFESLPDSGNPYLVVPCTYDSKKEGSFTLSFLSKEDLEIKKKVKKRRSNKDEKKSGTSSSSRSRSNSRSPSGRAARSSSRDRSSSRSPSGSRSRRGRGGRRGGGGRGRRGRGGGLTSSGMNNAAGAVANLYAGLE